MKGRENKIYIAYGSNLNIEQMSCRCPYATPIGNGILRNYGLLFRGGSGGAVATVEPKRGCSVPVLLREITPRCEDQLDRYEGWPRLYRKETVGVEYDGKIVEAMIYVMNEGYELGNPSQQYLNVILEGYESADFDPQILSNALTTSARKRKKKGAVQ